MKTIISPGRFFRAAVIGAFILFGLLAYQSFALPLEPWIRIVSPILFILSVGGVIDAFVSKVVSQPGAFRIVGLLYSITVHYYEIEDVIIEESVMFIKKKNGSFQKLPDWVATTQRNKHILLNEIKAAKTAK